MDARLTLCPRCGSPEVGTDRIPHMGQQHNCPECGYQGSFVIEADSPEDAERIHDELQDDWEAQREDEEADAEDEEP